MSKLLINNLFQFPMHLYQLYGNAMLNQFPEIKEKHLTIFIAIISESIFLRCPVEFIITLQN